MSPITGSNLPGIALGNVGNTDALPAPSAARGRAIDAGGNPPISLGGYSLVDRTRRLDPRVYTGIERETFANGPALASAAGLAVSTSGGIRAAVSGVAGQGDIRLPATIDPSVPFAFGALVKLGATDDAGRLDILITSPGDTNYGVTFGVQLAATFANRGGKGQQVRVANVDPGIYELYIVGDGTKVTYGWKPQGPVPLGVVTGVGTKGNDNCIVGAWDELRYDGVNRIWANCTIVRVSTNSVNHELLSCWLNVNGMTRPKGSTYGTCRRAVLLTPTDYDTEVLMPKGYDGLSPVDLIFDFHPNASDKLLGSNAADAGGGVVPATLREAGYMIAYVRGDTASYISAGASPWGGTTGLLTRKAMLDRLLTDYPQIRNVYGFGLSMGLLDALTFHATYPGILRAVVGVSGVCNLTYAYNSEGFSGVINTGQGVASIAATSDRDPNLRPASYADLPMLLYHGDADTVVHKANHPDIFAPRVAAALGSCRVVNAPGGGHLDAAMWAGVSATDIAAFFAANQ